MEEQRIITLLARKLAGEATPEELEELERLMAGYPDSLYYEELLGQLWKQQPVKDEPADDAYKLHRSRHSSELGAPAMLAAGTNEKTVPAARRRLPVLIVLFAFLLLSSLITYVFYSASSAKKIEDLNVRIIAGKGIRKKLILPDGTKVWLNSDSRLAYDRNMNERGQRLVDLSGEAFFDVVKNPRKPFVIRTNRMSIKVLGTAFNVRSYPEEKKAETTLLRGMIELSVNNTPGQKIILRPSEKLALVEKESSASGKENRRRGQETLIIDNVTPVEIGNREYIEETSWKDNKLVFENQSLGALVPQLQRWFDVRISIRRQEIAGYHFTGVFTNENISEALEAMKLIRPFNFKINENDVIIY